jgi:hypothetical protein
MSKKNPLRKHKKRQKQEAHRKAWMEKRLARNLIVPDMAMVTVGTEGVNVLKATEQAASTVRLHRLLNKLAEMQVGDGFINALASALLEQMEAGYRLTFPVVIGQGRIVQCVALLARASDRRLKAIRQLAVPAEVTHVLVFLAFASEHEWLKQASLIKRLFPEQPDKPEWVFGAK